jgi:hypothetical protein
MVPQTYAVDENGREHLINGLGAKSLFFGILAPASTSKTKIVQLKVEGTAAIRNIKLSLIDSGGIDFNENIFGVDSRGFIDKGVVPESRFQGVSDKSLESEYNIDINNLNLLSSNYVYLNLNVPADQEFIAGTIRYQWIFDYA